MARVSAGALHRRHGNRPARLHIAVHLLWRPSSPQRALAGRSLFGVAFFLLADSISRPANQHITLVERSHCGDFRRTAGGRHRVTDKPSRNIISDKKKEPNQLGPVG